MILKKCQLNILHTSYLLSQNSGVRWFRVPGWPTLHTTQSLSLKMGEWNPLWEGSHSSVSRQPCDYWVTEFPKVVVTISTPTSRFALSPCSSPCQREAFLAVVFLLLSTSESGGYSCHLLMYSFLSMICNEFEHLLFLFLTVWILEPV